MDTIKNAGNYVADKVNSATSGASKEANKGVAKDNNAGIGTRYASPHLPLSIMSNTANHPFHSIQAAGSALGDKADESKHDASAEANKQKATH